MDRLPSVGDRVTHQHELWIVASVDEDLVGVIVVCELDPRGHGVSRVYAKLSASRDALLNGCGWAARDRAFPRRKP